MGKQLLIFIIFLPILLTTIYIVPVRYPIQSLYPVRGIDVSHHQGRIIWSALDSQKVQFAWIKASEGGDFRDSLFQYNWSESKKRNIPRGAYHFLTFCRSGRVQARNFIHAVGSFDSTDLIPVLDIEYGGNCKRRLTQKGMEKLISDFTAELRTASKNPPILYVTSDIYEDYFSDGRVQNRLWVRAILKSPSRLFHSDWTVWQYIHRGKISGINGPVDLNVIHGKNLDSLYNR